MFAQSHFSCLNVSLRKLVGHLYRINHYFFYDAQKTPRPPYSGGWNESARKNYVERVASYIGDCAQPSRNKRRRKISTRFSPPKRVRWMPDLHATRHRKINCDWVRSQILLPLHTNFKRKCFDPSYFSMPFMSESDKTDHLLFSYLHRYKTIQLPWKSLFGYGYGFGWVWKSYLVPL